MVSVSCTTVGPDYEVPDTDWLSTWNTDLYGCAEAPAGEPPLELGFWWHLFDDPVLDHLIELARLENPSLKIAGLRILESRAALGIANSALYPQVKQATGSASYVDTRQSGGSGPDNDQDMVTYQTGLGIGWELDFWGRFRRGIESADAAYFASIDNQRDLQVLLSAQVADVYYSYRSAVLRTEIAKKNAEIQKRSFEITEELYQSGEDSELDLQQAKTQYMSTLSQIPALELSQIKARNALCVLLGRAPGYLPELDEKLHPLPVVEAVVVEAVPARLLMRRPDVRAAAWQIAAQSAQIGMAQSQLYPSISLLGSVGWSGNSRSESPETLSLGIGPSFTWNLFDFGNIKNQVRIQDARLQQAIENFQNTVLEAALEIDNAAVSIVKTRAQQHPQQEATVAAKRSLELANVRYREGYASFQRVIDAQRSVVSQTEREVINDSNHISAIIDFYKAMGGGWLNATIDEIAPEPMREKMEDRVNWGDLLTAPLPNPTPSPFSPEESSNE